MKRTFCILLAVLLAAMSLAACSEKPSDSPTDAMTPGSENETAEIPETEETEIPDNLPDVTYDGYTYRVASYSEKIGIEEETGEVLNDALFRRDKAVEERFDIILEGVVHDDYTAATNAVKQAVTAGTNDYTT